MASEATGGYFVRMGFIFLLATLLLVILVGPEYIPVNQGKKMALAAGGSLLGPAVPPLNLQSLCTAGFAVEWREGGAPACGVLTAGHCDFGSGPVLYHSPDGVAELSVPARGRLHTETPGGYLLNDIRLLLSGTVCGQDVPSVFYRGQGRDELVPVAGRVMPRTGMKGCTSGAVSRRTGCGEVIATGLAVNADGDVMSVPGGTLLLVRSNAAINKSALYRNPGYFNPDDWRMADWPANDDDWLECPDGDSGAPFFYPERSSLTGKMVAGYAAGLLSRGTQLSDIRALKPAYGALFPGLTDSSNRCFEMIVQSLDVLAELPGQVEIRQIPAAQSRQ